MRGLPQRLPLNEKHVLKIPWGPGRLQHIKLPDGACLWVQIALRHIPPSSPPLDLSSALCKDEILNGTASLRRLFWAQCRLRGASSNRWRWRLRPKLYRSCLLGCVNWSRHEFLGISRRCCSFRLATSRLTCAPFTQHSGLRTLCIREHLRVRRRRRLQRVCGSSNKQLGRPSGCSPNDSWS